MKRNRLASTLGLLAAGLGAGCAEEQAAPLYQLVPVSQRDIVVSASAAGAVEPVLTVDVKSKASGEIIELRVDVGDVVRAGQLMIKVDPRVPNNALQQAQADLEVARAQLSNAQSQLRRAEELFKTQSITEQEHENARLQAANANAQLIRAQRSLEDARIAFEDTEVRAPISGMIIAKAVEVGTVIQSATSGVSGGAILLQMADLDTVQVRSLVDETDIGKIQRGMPVTITVEAYPNRPFGGEVLKIEPQATVQQNVTMFPVLVRIGNREGLLKPGMNAEVEVHVGRREGVLAVPNAALRTQRDVNSAGMVLGLAPETVQEQIAAARSGERPANGRASLGGSVPDSTDAAGGRTMMMGDRQITLPEGVKAEDVRKVFEKMRSGGPSGLSAAERALLQRMRGPVGGAGGGDGMRGGGPGGFNNRGSGSDNLFGGNYFVFVMRGGQPTAVPVQTGLTDLDYSEVRSGLSPQDTVLLLPSASLVESQRDMQERMQRFQSRSSPISTRGN